GPQIEAARQKLEFFTKDYKGKLGDFLNDPENAKRLFDQTSVAANDDSQRGKLLAELLERLEQQEIIYHVMSSYEIRPIIETYCPPVHLQQLRKALVSKEERKLVESILKQVPARMLALKPIQHLSKNLLWYSRQQKLSFVVIITGDFFT